MLELSDNAVREIKELTDTGGLRFVAQEAGDGDWQFDPSLVDEPEEGDQVVERGGAKVFLDALAAEKLAEVMLEIHAHGDHVHFEFVRKGGEDEETDADEGDAESDADSGNGPAAA